MTLTLPNINMNARFSESFIHGLSDSKGERTVNPQSITNELRDYYQSKIITTDSKQDSDLNDECV